MRYRSLSNSVYRSVFGLGGDGCGVQLDKFRMFGML